MTALLTSLYSNMLFFIAFAVLSALMYRCVVAQGRQYALLAINGCFYWFCCGWYVAIMLLIGIWTYYCAQQIQHSPHRRGWLMAGIVPTVMSLAGFKYAKPIASMISALLPADAALSIANLLIPLGISYYALKAISYLYDIYIGKYTSEHDGCNYLAYLTFFGQIIAGPIQRYDQWSQSLRKGSHRQDFADAYYLLIRGLFLKLIIAKRIGPYVIDTLANIEAVNGLNLWLGFFLYAIYIYTDFAGYSYIAIGVTRLFGIHCPDNFRLPYFSTNVREFWSRWHISLSTWLRDYIYIPLGGNRLGQRRRIINLLITFLVSGIWHGSTLNFVVWGGYHGVLNALSPKGKTQQQFCWRMLPSIVGTFLLVSLGWIIFATPDLTSAFLYLHGMFTRTTLGMEAIQGAILPFTYDNTCLSHFLVAMFFVVVLMAKEFCERFLLFRYTPARSFIWQVFMLTSLILFGLFGSVSFIYAGF